MGDMNSASGDVAPISPGIVPELLITDLATSLNFWVTLCGFEILYDRPKEGFAYLHSGTAHIMLEQIGVGRNWVPGTLERPLGRGVNFQVTVPEICPWSNAFRPSAGRCSWLPKTSGTKRVTQRPECPGSSSRTPTAISFDSLHG